MKCAVRLVLYEMSIKGVRVGTVTRCINVVDRYEPRELQVACLDLSYLRWSWAGDEKRSAEVDQQYHLTASVLRRAFDLRPRSVPAVQGIDLWGKS
jgi:hypothetical protein